jgi:GNAT superfamily N-acetyltransferase
MMKPQLKALTENDIPALLELAKTIGWGYNAENWAQFFRLGVVLGHREIGGQLISSAVMIKYGDSLRWLTSFIVSPRFQRLGLARELWQGLKAADPSPHSPIGLISTDEGIPFYESIGFKQVDLVHKYVRANGLGINYSVPRNYTLRAASIADLEIIVAMDEAARGVYRREMLDGKLRASKIILVTCDSTGLPNGFAIAAMEGDLLCIGPVVAPDESSAADLIIGATRNHAGPVRVDLVSGKSDLMQVLIKHEFKLERVPPVLSYAGSPLPKTSHQYMALAAQALG